MKNLNKSIAILLAFTTVLMIILQTISSSSRLVAHPNLGGIQTYIHPYNNSIHGLHFKTTELAEKLMQQLERGGKVDEYSIETFSKALTPVTAISSNHFNELMKHVDKVRLFLPNKTLIVYDLGLSKQEVSSLQKIDFIEYRTFDFSAYPKHVKNLQTYAWKPLIIQQVLAERGGVLWMDASVLLKQQDDSVICSTVILRYMVNNKCGFLYYLGSPHSIVSATHPQMFQYLPMKNLDHMKSDMQAATGMLMFNTAKVRHLILRWAILCSLEQECIAPTGSKLYCGFNFPVDRFGGCHRYDQSMMSILVANAFDSQTGNYTLPIHLQTFAVIDRS